MHQKAHFYLLISIGRKPSGWINFGSNGFLLLLEHFEQRTSHKCVQGAAMWLSGRGWIVKTLHSTECIREACCVHRYISVRISIMWNKINRNEKYFVSFWFLVLFKFPKYSEQTVFELNWAAKQIFFTQFWVTLILAAPEIYFHFKF